MAPGQPLNAHARRIPPPWCCTTIFWAVATLTVATFPSFVAPTVAGVATVVVATPVKLASQLLSAMAVWPKDIGRK